MGLSDIESRAYLALVRGGSLGASAVAELVGIPRSTVYPILHSLVERGLVEGGAGRGSRYRVVRPEDALPTFIEREREALEERERLAKELSGVIGDLAAEVATDDPEVVEVIRNRRGIADRFARLQLGAERSIELFVKAPFLNPRAGNPEEQKALARGIRYRAIYESAVLDDPAIQPYFRDWVADGEEARLYPGVLPMKLALFDSSAALMPLETLATREQVTAILIRHASLAVTLRMFFDALWETSELIPSS